MTLRVALNHVTHYRYDRPVELGPQLIRLRPAPHCRTTIIGYSLRVSPEHHFLNWLQDPQGNFLARVVLPERIRELEITVDLVAEMTVINPFDFFVEESAEHWPFEYDRNLAHELAPCLQTRRPGRLLAAWLDEVPRETHPTVSFLVDLNRRLYEQIEYVIRMEAGVQTPHQTLQSGRGSCRDSAWLLVHILRQLGIAARFASGYLIQLTPDVESLDGPSGPKADFTDLHAWAEAYVPGAGWIGLDPTSGLLAGEGHIPLACGPAPQSAAPITGVVELCEVEFEHRMSVTRVLETPRVTKPYSDEQWQRLLALGAEVDRRLEREQVRLTMGGEPTFVSIDHVDTPEWNTEAVGPTKRARAEDLARRLQARFAPDGLLHYGQGKWYPGEPLPRWAFSIYWRGDGRPLWRDPARIAEETRDYAVDHAAARELARGIARALAIDPDCTVPAYEDPLPLLAREGSLPENVDVLDSKLDDPQERERLRRIFSRGLERPVGFVLPVQAWNARDGARRWRSERWRLRRGRLYLAAGDSPVGFRLPLASLPHLPADAYPHTVPADPGWPHGPLPEPRWQGAVTGPHPSRAQPAAAPASEPPVRTALAVEPRDGRLCVFLPPVETADDFVDLVGAIEEAASEQGHAIHLEGYPPPWDERLNVIQVTPDPGVIEVNVHPASSWDDLVEITTAVYEEARLARLGTEKFMLDGRHAGTGGGNHVVLGGSTPLDSPFLRRPDLLRSLLAYWLDHPSLSYLFSGLFIGPTSQSPRVDEARHEAIYELEIAFGQIPGPGQGECPPWLVDRILRNLLVDVTGNTHRAEFCIDKLYSPDSASGRRGLLELRSFEMPPHARMSLAQQLLLRALIARFWEQPYQARLARWGTSLHDRFLLPHWVWEDFGEVLDELRRFGIGFDRDLYRSHFEFRFPLYGTIRDGGVEVELRQALEPWHVLGEEGVVGGTARYVDSSLERLQVRVRGLGDGRYAVGCNGWRVPLQPTGREGESVAGVRFRAWQPPRCLHPTIGVHAPLTFDLVDTWTGRAVAGCRYHVAHPGGRNFEDFPVNAYEAEARRQARFFAFGHTPGSLALRDPGPNREHPCTLDLRACPTGSGAEWPR